MKLLRGGDGKPRKCEDCGRTISVRKDGRLRRHKRSRHSEGFCRGFMPGDEKRAKDLFVKANRTLTHLAMAGSWGQLEHVSRATLKAAGVPS